MAKAPQIPTPWPGPEFTITFKPSKLKTLLLLAVGLLFVAAGAWAGIKKHDTILILCAGFFALCSMIFCIQLHPRASYLVFKQDGFIFCSLFRSHEVRWKDVQGFGVQIIGHNKMVVWNYAPEFTAHSRGRRIATTLTGCEAALPDTYGFKAEDLAGVMNQLRELYLLETASVRS